MKRVNYHRVSHRNHRHNRVMSRVREGNERIRLRFTKSNSHMYVQALDDAESRTVASSSSLSLKLKNGNRENCIKIGEDMAKKLKKINVSKLSVDRGGHSYFGRIAVIVDKLREEGFNV